MYGMGESVSSKAQGFQAITQDLLTVLNEVPFGIPPSAREGRRMAYGPPQQKIGYVQLTIRKVWLLFR